jgi:hypothetical protein
MESEGTDGLDSSAADAVDSVDAVAASAAALKDVAVLPLENLEVEDDALVCVPARSA